MAGSTPPPSQPGSPRSSDYSAGASAPRAAARRWGRPPRVLGWVLASVVALLLVSGTVLWWWAGSSASLAYTLQKAAQYLPAAQQLESRDVSGSLRRGGHIGWLRWSSPDMVVEVTDITLGWQLASLLLQQRLELTDVHASRVQITPRDTPRPEPEPPIAPPTQVVLPIKVGVSLHVDEVNWAASPTVQAHDLRASYRFDGHEHHLNIASVQVAQGRYAAQATLQAHAPMALQARLDGMLRAQVPGDGTALQVGAHITLEGTLATTAAQLRLRGRINPEPDAAKAPQAVQPPDSAASSPAVPATSAASAGLAGRASQPQAGSRAASGPTAESPGAQPMQAQIEATLSPWAPQPLQSATAMLQALDLAAFWPSAPATQISGTVQAGPVPVDATGTAPGSRGGWSIQAQLRNELAGPWDTSRLPVSAIEASARYDGQRWSVPGATFTIGTGSATVQGEFIPATGALDGQAELRNLRPDAVHTALEAAPLGGRVTAKMQGEKVRFTADIRAASASPAAAARPVRRAGVGGSTLLPPSAPLRINALTAQGTWQPAVAQGTRGGTVMLDRVLLDALQARLDGTRVRVVLGDPAGLAAEGQVTLAVPGASAQASGTVAAQSGNGQLQVRWSDVQQTQRWLATLPLVGGTLQGAMQGASAQGSAQLQARWTGGWQTLQQQLQAAGIGTRAGTALPAASGSFDLQASLATPQLDLQLPAEGATAATVQLRSFKAQLDGNLAQAALSLDGEVRREAAPASQIQRVAVQTQASAALAGPGQWKVLVSQLRLQAQDARHPGAWTLQLAEPLTVIARTKPDATPAAPGPPRPSTAGGIAIETSAGRAQLSGPAPGTVTLRWQPVRVSTMQGLQLQTEGTLQGLPMAWVDALGLGATPAAGGQPAEPLLSRIGLSTNIVLDGQWKVDTTGTLRASASLRRASGDLRILAGDPMAVQAVQSRGPSTGASADTAIATQAPSNAPGAGTPAGVRTAEVSVNLEGEALRARLQWASERAGDIDASLGTRLSLPSASGPGGVDLAGASWAENAPLEGTLRASLPDVGAWSALAPPGWRVRGTLQANASLSGTRGAPQWSGTLGADNLAVRSLIDGVDLQNGRLRATLRGNQLQITEFTLQGGSGSGARIAGFSGNRTAAPQDGGTLTGTGTLRWNDAAGGATGIGMSFEAEAKALQVLVRADRQLSVSGKLQGRLRQGQITLRGNLTANRATIILPDESAPTLGSDVVVRSAALDKLKQDQAKAKAQAAQGTTQVEGAKPPELDIAFNLGPDFALQGHGITTRLTGEIQLRSSSTPGAPPRVTGEVRTEAGRYRAWGQILDVETGLIRFNGPYDNPSLDILALRPNISVRAGVRVTGSAKAPRVRLYSDPELPDAEKLSWVVLGRSAAAGGAEAAVLQQAALALLGRGGNNNTAGNIASRVGLDEIGFKGPASGEGAEGAALTFGKRLSSNLYVTYERSLSGTLGTLYIFYDLTRRLTLRGQTGEKSAVDLIYTIKYD